MPTEERGQLILAQNQYAFVQDATKGHVSVYAGPHASGLRQDNDVPVTFDNQRGTFVKVMRIEEAIRQSPLVPEGHYIVLENPAFGVKGELNIPKSGSNLTPELQTGKKINIPGPTTFPLWPGQSAQAIPGHHLRSNQYLVVRVYNADEAKKDQDFFEGDETELVNGQLIVIKGTQMSFFIPPTGYEVLQEGATYVREALTLERLEYCILLDEDGNKRYERGPQVVFPKATEKFVEKQPGQKKHKAVELNDQMGLYIKVIADYEEPAEPAMQVQLQKQHRTRVATQKADDAIPAEMQNTIVSEGGREFVFHDGRWFAQYRTGEELFITGKVQRIYYPLPEHALIEYDDPNSQGKFKRQRYYGIAIPNGEGRYVLDKDSGEVQKVTGPQIFLPDPRRQVVVRRVLDQKVVELWYPGNDEAAAYNQMLSALNTASGENFVTESNFAISAPDIARSLNRLTEKSRSVMAASASASYTSGAESINRGGVFTPPPTLTLNTKYDGVPSINIWTGWAVQIVDKSGKRRVEIGPCSILLNYDETLEMLSLSTGKPKTTDRPLRDVYLRVDNNLVSDFVDVETKDLVQVKLKLSYRVNFLREFKDKWFSVENYVKYLCDHGRSMLKAAAKQYGIKELIENSATIVRDTMLGVKKEDDIRTKRFPENGMELYDVEVLGTDIVDQNVAGLLKSAQQEVVKSAITLSIKEQQLENSQRETKIDIELANLASKAVVKKNEALRESMISTAKVELEKVLQTIEKESRLMQANVDKQDSINLIAKDELQRQKGKQDLILEGEEKRITFFEKQFAAFTPKLIEAMLTLGKNQFATILAESVSRMAVAERTGVQAILERMFAGTPFENILENLKSEVSLLPEDN